MLARDLRMTRASLIRSVTAAEFNEWAALYRLEVREREQAAKGAKGNRGASKRRRR